MHTDIIMMIVFLIDLSRCDISAQHSYLASLAAVDSVVEARGLVAAHPAEHVVIVVEF